MHQNKNRILQGRGEGGVVKAMCGVDLDHRKEM